MSELESLAAGMVIQYSERLSPEPDTQFKMRASELARDIELETTVNRAPRMIAAASVYLTSLARESGYIQDEICNAFDCSGPGLRKAYYDIADADGWEFNHHTDTEKEVQSTNGREMGGADGSGRTTEEEADKIARIYSSIVDSVSLSSKAKEQYDKRKPSPEQEGGNDELLDGPNFPQTIDKYEAIEAACVQLHEQGYSKARCQRITEVTKRILEERGFKTSLRSASTRRFLSAGKFERWSDTVSIEYERDPPGAGWWYIHVVGDPE